jgi:hypothetical protein
MGAGVCQFAGLGPDQRPAAERAHSTWRRAAELGCESAAVNLSAVSPDTAVPHLQTLVKCALLRLDADNQPKPSPEFLQWIHRAQTNSNPHHMMLAVWLKRGAAVPVLSVTAIRCMLFF